MSYKCAIGKSKMGGGCDNVEHTHGKDQAQSPRDGWQSDLLDDNIIDLDGAMVYAPLGYGA
jgi:hypothetical protein